MTPIPAAESPKAWDENLQDFGDRWNPLLVREIRRTTKSPLFATTFMLMTLACLVMSYYLYLTGGPVQNLQEAGSEYCTAYLCLLAFPVLVIVPMSIFTAVKQERIGQTLEMLTITNLPTHMLIDGFLWSGVVHSSIYFSAVLPFISFSYLLNGVGILELLGCLFIVCIAGLMTFMWGLTMGTFVRGTFTSSLCSILVLLGCSFTLMVTTSIIQTTFFYGTTEALICSSACLMMFLLIGWIILYGSAQMQIRLYDDLEKPYVVMVDNAGKIQFRVRTTYYSGAQQPVIYNEIPD